MNPPKQQSVHSSHPHESRDRDAAPLPPPTARSESSDPEPVSWWPPQPLVLGSRIYHWACYNVRVQHVVRTPRTAELHVINVNNNQPMVINSPRLVHFRANQSDYVDLFGLAEMSVEQVWHFTSAVNRTQPSWIMLDSWENTIPWQLAVTHFRIRRKRSELYDLIKQYLTATIEIALRDLGASGAELIALRDKAVNQRLKTQFRLPWFNLPT